MSCTINKLYFKTATTSQRIEAEITLANARKRDLSIVCNGKTVDVVFGVEPIDPEKGKYRVTTAFSTNPGVYMCTFKCNDAEADFGFVAADVDPHNLVVTKVSKLDLDIERLTSVYQFLVAACQSAEILVIITLDTDCVDVLAWICTPFDCAALAPVNSQIVFEYRFGPFGGTVGPTIRSYSGFYPGGYGNVPSLWGGFPADVMQLEYNYYYINQIRERLKGVGGVVSGIVDAVLKHVYEINWVPCNAEAFYYLKNLSKAEETDEYVKYKFLNADITLYKMPRGCNVEVKKVDISIHT